MLASFNHNALAGGFVRQLKSGLQVAMVWDRDLEKRPALKSASVNAELQFFSLKHTCCNSARFSLGMGPVSSCSECPSAMAWTEMFDANI